MCILYNKKITFVYFKMPIKFMFIPVIGQLGYANLRFR